MNEARNKELDGIVNEMRAQIDAWRTFGETVLSDVIVRNILTGRLAMKDVLLKYYLLSHDKLKELDELIERVEALVEYVDQLTLTEEEEYSIEDRVRATQPPHEDPYLLMHTLIRLRSLSEFYNGFRDYIAQKESELNNAEQNEGEENGGIPFFSSDDEEDTFGDVGEEHE